MKKCPFCSNDIQNEAIKCRFCHKWINDISNITNELKTLKNKTFSKEINKDLENLRSKSWYRFLKIIYVVVFCFSIFYVLSDIGLPKKIFSSSKIIVNCEDYRNFEEVPTDSGHGLIYRNNIANIKENNKVVESCQGKSFYINLDFFVIFEYLLALLSVVLVFEILRQAGYYIFLGKFYPHRSIAKLIRFRK